MQKEDKVKHTFTIITAFSVISLYLTVNSTGMPLESVESSFLLGLVLFLYTCWFIFETHTIESIGIKEAAIQNLKNNPAIWGIGIYYLVVVFLLIHAYM